MAVVLSLRECGRLSLVDVNLGAFAAVSHGVERAILVCVARSSGASFWRGLACVGEVIVPIVRVMEMLMKIWLSVMILGFGSLDVWF